MTIPHGHRDIGLIERDEGAERTRTAASVPTLESDKAPQKRQGWVYLVYDGGWSYKIGYARDPEKRLSLLQTGSVEPLRIVGVINAPSSLERELHELFTGDRIRGEWFVQSDALLGYFEDHGWVCTCPGYRRRSAPVDAECFIHGEGHAPW